MIRLALIAMLMSGTIAAAAAPPRADEVEYTVKQGDTLIDLAKRGFRRQADYIVVQRRNRITNPRALQPGSKLEIPVRVLRIQPIGAKVIAFRGAALVSGEKPRIGMPVREGSTLLTGADAFLTLELEDGSLLTLPSRSTMKVRNLRRFILTGTTVKTFELLGGRSETEVQKAVRAQDRFEIHTPVSVAAVRGTKFRVTFGSDTANAGASVLDGVVGVEAGHKTVSVPKGQGLVATAKGPGPVLPLLPKPALQNGDRLQDEDLVTFLVSPLAGARSYRIQIAKDAGFIETFAEAEGPGPAITLPDIQNGSFFARVTAISPEGIEGFPSVYNFERRLNSIKAEVDEAEQCPAQRCLRFRWRAGGEGERRYRFQLSMKPGGLPIIDEPEMREAQIVVTDLPGGTYYWRVESTLIERGQRQSKWMDYQELHVAPASHH